MKEAIINYEEYLKKTSVFNLGLSKTCEAILYEESILTLHDLVVSPGTDALQSRLSLENLIDLTNLIGRLMEQLLTSFAGTSCCDD